MEEERPFRPEGYTQCYLALDALQVGDDITPENYKTIKAMLDSSDEENLAMAEIALWEKYKGITIKYKKS
jgi:hypothetical protein